MRTTGHLSRMPRLQYALIAFHSASAVHAHSKPSRHRRVIEERELLAVPTPSRNAVWYAELIFLCQFENAVPLNLRNGGGNRTPPPEIELCTARSDGSFLCRRSRDGYRCRIKE
uniref:Putative secreted protein n=1 Tax=Ixodes ricinus TaxID=34613 RepID=A0A6B0UKK6_IXORI